MVPPVRSRDLEVQFVLTNLGKPEWSRVWTGLIWIIIFSSRRGRGYRGHSLRILRETWAHDAGHRDRQ
jgi:hypothetical protein